MSWGAASAESAEPGYLSDRRQIDAGSDRCGEAVVFRLARGHGPRCLACVEPLTRAQRLNQRRAQRVVFENPVEHRADFHPVKDEITTYGSKIYRDYRPGHTAPTAAAGCRRNHALPHDYAGIRSHWCDS